MTKIEEYLDEIEECLEAGQHLDSLVVRPVVRNLRARLSRECIALRMYVGMVKETKRLQKVIRRKNKLIKRLRSSNNQVRDTEPNNTMTTENLTENPAPQSVDSIDCYCE